MLIVDRLPATHQALLAAASTYPHTSLSDFTRLEQHSTHAYDWYTLGCYLLLCERHHDAQPYLEQAREAASQHADQVWIVHCERALAKLALDTCDPTNSEVWMRLVDAYRALGLRNEAERTAVYLAEAWYRQRNAHQVLDTLAQIELTRQPADVQAYALRLRAAALIQNTQFSEAQQALDQAIEQCTSHSYLPELARCWLSQGWALFIQGEYKQAQQILTNAEQLLQALRLPLRQAQVANTQSICYAQQGNYQQALYYLSQASTTFQAYGSELDAVSCDYTRALMYLRLGHPVAAQSELLRVEHIFTKYNAAGRLPSLLYNVARLYLEQGMVDAAEELFPRVRMLAEQNSLPEIVDELNLLAAQAAMLRGADEHALHLYEQLNDYYQHYNNVHAQERIALAQAEIYFQRGETERAEQLFNLALTGLINEPMLGWRCFYGLARCAEQNKTWSQALKLYQQALAIIAEIRQQLINEQLSSLVYQQAVQLFYAAMRCAYTHGSAEQVFAMTEQQRSLTLVRAMAHEWQQPVSAEQQALEIRLRQLTTQRIEAGAATLVEQLDQQLAALLDTYARQLWQDRHRELVPSTEFIQAVSIEQIQAMCTQQHGLNWSVLTYTEYPDGYYICAITPDTLEISQCSLSAAQRQLIRDLNNPFKQRRIYADTDYLIKRTPHPHSQLAELAETLLPAVVRQRLIDDHRLYIVPGTALHALPWATLRLEQAWLCERAIIHVLPHSMFAALPALTTTGSGALWGCSTFELPLVPLTSVEAEFALLERLWPAAVEAHCQATRNEFMQANLSDAALLHFSTHAAMTYERGLAGYLAFCDDYVWLDQITRLRLRQALVVLSACAGARVDSLPGEEYFSLAWSWLIAGAAGVVATLWEVKDGATLPLLQAFYTYIRAGKDAAAALAYAQRDCATGQCDQLCSPSEWGAFIFSGRNLSFQFHGGVGAP